MWQDSTKIFKTIQNEDWARHYELKEQFWGDLERYIEGSVLPEFLARFSQQIEAIIDVNPELPEKRILEIITSHIVNFLGALLASVRIYDPDTERMISYGSYPYKEGSREISVPLENSIAGEVVRSQRPFLVPNIMKENLFQDKSIIEQRGANSLMAIPFRIPRFYEYERDTAGVIQIYYPEIDRKFTPLEIQIAEIMSHRMSYVIALKKIHSMQMTNRKKETIVRKIFLNLGLGEGIKMKEVFNRVIPELVDIINIQSCALFSVDDDLEHVTLEAGFPDSLKHHGIGMRFEIRKEPVFAVVLNLKDYHEGSPYEIVTQSYVLIIDPQKSLLISENTRRLAMNRNINSILYVPLSEGEETTHFMTFDAIEQREAYSPEEIDIMLFLGRELIKAQRIERLDDILHDYKNPAIATAGFARRLKQLLSKETLKEEEKIKKYVDILFEETSRMQEMALSISNLDNRKKADLSEILKRRFEINKEAIHEQLRQNVVLEEGPYEDNLTLKGYPVYLERVMDNLLNNATKAVPLHGGTISARTYRDGDWACAEISNSGTITEEEKLRLLEGKSSGRGLYITRRIISLLNGKIDIRAGRDNTTFIVRLPISAA